MAKSKIVDDCRAYFILSKESDLDDLFKQKWAREPGVDYYPEISALCLDWEFKLVNASEEWDEDHVIDFEEAFKAIVPTTSPNYSY